MIVMSPSVTDRMPASHPVIGDIRGRMAKATLPSGENAYTEADLRAQIGACLDCARRDVGWTVDQLSAELGRDSKQVARWMRGEENVQVHVVFKCRVLRGPFVVALAQLSGECDVVTEIRVRRVIA